MSGLLTLQHSSTTASAAAVASGSGLSRSGASAAGSSSARRGGAAAAGTPVTLFPVNILLQAKSECEGDTHHSGLDSHFTFPHPGDERADSPPFVRKWSHWFAWWRFELGKDYKRAAEAARPEVELRVQLQAGVLGGVGGGGEA